jgi:hypothetical protein
MSEWRKNIDGTFRKYQVQELQQVVGDRVRPTGWAVMNTDGSWWTVICQVDDHVNADLICNALNATEDRKAAHVPGIPQ